MIGPRRMHLLGLLVFLVICIVLAWPRMGFGAEPYASTTDYYNCEFLGYCPQGNGGKTYEPEMWKTVKCFEAVGKVCPAKPETHK